MQMRRVSQMHAEINMKKHKTGNSLKISSTIPALLVAALLFLALSVCSRAADIEIKKIPSAGTTIAAPAPESATATIETPAEEEPEYTGPKEISAANDFIKIIVNTMPVDTGRFLVRTVKGDPTRDSDDDKILIYGGATPWTSFTTLRIDGKNYVFGGTTKRRAGRDALYGEVTEQPHVVGNSVVTRCTIAGLDVTETLSIAGGPVSKLYDTVKISYTIRNVSGESHLVGVRAVIDTLLGSNDASPFKVGDKSITTETELTGAAIQDYWIAYDSLENPGVVARGTLRGPGLDAPDRVIFANWGKIADNIWEFPYSPDQTFMREGEESMDSATALYWNEKTISPQGELQYATLYGIEYLNVTGDILSIGALRHLGEWSTAKNQIRQYTLYAYVSNSAKIGLSDVVIKLELPEGIEFAGGDSGERRLGSLNSGQEQTIGWVVQPKVGAGGEKTINVVGSAKELAESVSLKTGVTLLSPPGIIPTVVAPDRVTRAKTRESGPYGPPFAVQLKCRNDGGSPIDNLRVSLVLPQGLEFPHIQNEEQLYSKMEGKQEVVFSWKVIATGDKSGKMDLKFIITSDSTEDKVASKSIEVDPLPVSISWTGVPEETSKNLFFTAELYVTDIVSLGSAELSVKYDPSVLQVVRVSQGTLFVQNGQPLPWSEPEINNKAGVVSGIKGTRMAPLTNNEGSLVIVNFRTLGPGASDIEALNLDMSDLTGVRTDFQLEKAAIRVK
jgi:hypothetical protein